MKTKCILFLSLVFYALSGLSEIEARERPLSIIYTGSINGELEPCGCSPKTDLGGLARLSGYLAAHKDELGTYILIDAGNFTDRDTPQGRMKAGAVLKSYRIMEYDAVALMSHEQTFPFDFLSPVLEGSAVPAVSDALPVNRSIIVNRNGLDVNISVDPGDLREQGLNILLTDRPVSESGLMRGWDVIITSSGEALEEPVISDGTIILSGYPRGKKTGVLTLPAGTVDSADAFSHTWLSLGVDVGEDPRVRAVLNEYDSNVAGLMKESARPPAGDTYLGASRCAACHQPYEESWKRTRHASAFDSLVRAGKSNDPECIVCHALGYGEKGGFFSYDTTPELANVQCEECHGLDREHVEDFSRPMRQVTEKVCLKCHTRENSPDFDFPVYLERIIH